MTTPSWSIAVVVFACMIGAYGAVLFKKASEKLRFSILALIKNMYIWGGAFFYLFSTILFVPALKYGDLSVLYPFVATTYVWVSIYSVKLLNEKMNAAKWWGIIFILIGVSLIGLGA